MKQIIYLGFVVNVNYAGRLHFAQVRIPAVHGIPLSNHTNLNTTKSTAEFQKTCNYNVEKSNGNLTIDAELPWYPLCYPFGNNIGPSVGDIVFVLLEAEDSALGIVIGWSGSQMVDQRDRTLNYNNFYYFMESVKDQLSPLSQFNFMEFFGWDI